ncbi:hypothetical protein THAOC_01752, partial [Thalassiosira oceanica]
ARETCRRRSGIGEGRCEGVATTPGTASAARSSRAVAASGRRRHWARARERSDAHNRPPSARYDEATLERPRATKRSNPSSPSSLSPPPRTTGAGRRRGGTGTGSRESVRGRTSTRVAVVLPRGRDVLPLCPWDPLLPSLWGRGELDEGATRGGAAVCAYVENELPADAALTDALAAAPAAGTAAGRQGLPSLIWSIRVSRVRPRSGRTGGAYGESRGRTARRAAEAARKTTPLPLDLAGGGRRTASHWGRGRRPSPPCRSRARAPHPQGAARPSSPRARPGVRRPLGGERKEASGVAFGS